MYNPLKLLSVDILADLIMRNHFYFVRQSYPRGKTPYVKEAFLITPYKTWDKANEHYIAIKYDRRKYLYNLNPADGDLLSRDSDKEKLFTAARQPEKYKVFIDKLQDKRWTPPKPLHEQIHHHLSHIGWAHMNNKIDAKLSFDFGRLIVRFTCKQRKDEIYLDDLEKY